MKFFLTVFWRSMKPHKGLLWLTGFLGVLLACLWVVEPLFGRYAVDELLKLAGGERADILRVFAIWIVIYLAVSLTQGGNFYVRWKVNNHLLTNIREYYFEQLLHLDVRHHIKARGGELMKRLDNAADASSELARQMLMELPTATLTSILFFAMSIFVSWKLSLIVLAMVPVYVVLIWLSVKKTRREMDKVNRLWSWTMGRAYDVLTNIFTVKSSAAESRELRAMHAYHAEGIRDLDRVNVTWALLEGVGYFMLLRIMLIGVGILLYLRGEISLGSVFFFQFGFFRIVVPLEMLSHMMPFWNEKIGKIELAEEVFHRDIEVKSKAEAKQFPDLRGAITLKNVSFSYTDTEALHSVNLEIAPGEHIAIVGHSGAGKSTVAMLLNRFYDVSDGAILIDGIDLRELDVYWWRKQIGLVLQENIMFNDSVLENIRYSRQEATEGDVIEAAKRSHAHEFIERLPEGYATAIGERGIRLSGGERQRIAVARAILKKPKIVVLDEATSALDSKTEKAVQEGIRELILHRTAIIIAHRLSTVSSVDRIAVLHHGNLIACAPHVELLKTCDIYREMVELQSHGLLAE